MISSGHMHKVLIDTFPGNQSHDTLNWKGSPVNEISVEKILIFRSWILVKFENIKHIIILTVNVSTHSKFLLILDLIFDQRIVLLNDILTFLNQLKRVPLVEMFLVLVMLHQFHNPKLISDYHSAVTYYFYSSFGPVYYFSTSIYRQFL